MSRLFAAVLLVAALGGCGQSGDLYLPDRQPAPAESGNDSVTPEDGEDDDNGAGDAQ